MEIGTLIAALTRGMAIPDLAAMVLLVLAAPVCAWVAYTDLRFMRIRNAAVYTLFGLFVVAGPFLMSLSDYGWQLAHMPILLALGVAMRWWSCASWCRSKQPLRRRCRPSAEDL